MAWGWGNQRTPLIFVFIFIFLIIMMMILIFFCPYSDFTFFVFFLTSPFLAVVYFLSLFSSLFLLKFTFFTLPYSSPPLSYFFRFQCLFFPFNICFKYYSFFFNFEYFYSSFFFFCKYLLDLSFWIFITWTFSFWFRSIASYLFST